MQTQAPSLSATPRSHRLLRGVWLCLRSGGGLWVRALRLVMAVARTAPTYAEGACVLVPGHRLAYDEVPPAYARRLKRALRLWHPRCRLLLSGTSADDVAQSEALAGYVYLRDHGLPPGALVELDGLARDTAQNLADARQRLGEGAAVVIVSNRWHLARCVWLARAAGLRGRACAAERRLRLDPYVLLALAREAFLLLCDAGEAAILPTPKQLTDPEP